MKQSPLDRPTMQVSCFQRDTSTFRGVTWVNLPRSIPHIPRRATCGGSRLHLAAGGDRAAI
jgi:hypothetical protein